MTSNIQAVSDTLVANGVTTLFGLMGNGNLEFIAAMVDRCGVDYVSVRHESAAVAAADGYARASGRVGIATVTHGPGFTNALTALVTARKASTPLILITGSAMGYTHRSTQRLDHAAVAASLGVAVVAPSPDGDWAAATREALRRAAKGAVLLDLPAQATRRPAVVRPAQTETAPVPILPDPVAVTQASTLLAGAERLMIVAGRGAVRSGVRERLVALGRRHGAQFGTSLAVKGYFHGVDGDIGIIGGLASPASWAACRECDVALVVGASLNGFTTEHGTLLASAKVIRLDLDPRAPATIDVALALPGDPATTLAAIEAETGHENTERPPWRTAQEEPRSVAVATWPTTVFALLDRLIPDDRTMVFDHGDHANAALPHFRANHPTQSIFMTDFGSLGLSIAAAIGAAKAWPERRTVVIVGDGGLMMSLPELDTLKRSAAPILVVAVNNGAYGAEYPHLMAMGASLGPASFASQPIHQIAGGLGIRSMSLREGDNFAALDAFVLDAAAPALLEIICPPPGQGMHDHG